MINIRALCLSAILLSTSQYASAGAFVQGAYFQNYLEERSDDSKYFSRETQAHMSGGYLNSGYTIGLTYHYEDYYLAGSQANLESYGPAVGYIYEPMGVFVLASYLINPRLAYPEDGEKRYGGSGYVIELGKTWKIYDHVNVGIEAVRTHLLYKKYLAKDKTTGITTEKDDYSVEDHTKPMVTFAYWM